MLELEHGFQNRTMVSSCMKTPTMPTTTTSLGLGMDRSFLATRDAMGCPFYVAPRPPVNYNHCASSEVCSVHPPAGPARPCAAGRAQSSARPSKGATARRGGSGLVPGAEDMEDMV